MGDRAGQFPGTFGFAAYVALPGELAGGGGIRVPAGESLVVDTSGLE